MKIAQKAKSVQYYLALVRYARACVRVCVCPEWNAHI